MKGKGLNSIPVRFAVMTAVLTTICVSVQSYLWIGVGYERAPAALVAAVVGLAIIMPTAITWAAATKLTGQIRNLKRSTEAIVSGDFASPVDVDCACEVGGLADSFRKMVGRINSNIVRMNVLAYRDALTGLPNRLVIDHMLGHMTAGESSRTGAVLFIDLDGFKKVNDTLGHEAGDDLLKQVSFRIISKGLNRTPDQLDTCTTPFGELCDRAPNDIVFARFAGDEFVALFPDLSETELIEEVATSVLDAFEDPFAIQGKPVKVTASVGIARAPVDTDDPADLLNFADLAMYAAKQAGKNRYAFFDHALRELAIERDTLESDLRRAIVNGELLLHYQPKLDCQTLECVGVEALARWRHPTRGLVPPGIFIPIAEQAGLMPEMGAEILRMAARQTRAWSDAGTPRQVAVNISPAQFINLDLVQDILSVLEEFGADPRLIELEITESVAMSDFEATRRRLAELQEAGIRISIDDFGIGFSNLSQLAKLPFDALKIDQSLVAETGKSPKSENIVKAIIGMADALGHATVAEGIETTGQLLFLQRSGCRQVQGYLFARPMPAGELEAWVADRSRNPVGDFQGELGRSLKAS